MKQNDMMKYGFLALILGTVGALGYKAFKSKQDMNNNLPVRPSNRDIIDRVSNTSYPQYSPNINPGSFNNFGAYHAAGKKHGCGCNKG